MTTWLIRCFAFLLLMLPFVPAVADDPDDAEIARLVKQLGSDKFKEREAATKRLKEIGEPALDALGKATGTLEMRRRAEQIVAVGPEGKAISGGARMDGTMRLWDLNTGNQAAVFSVDGYIVTLAYSAKARLAATYTWTRIRLWDLETGKEVRKWTGHASDFFE